MKVKKELEGVVSGPSGRSYTIKGFLCPLICHNGGVCVKPDRCLCPPDFAGKFCQLHSSGARPPAPAMPGFTRSVYTMPLANHRDDEHGVASMVSVHVEHPQEASVVVHQVERVSGPWEEADAEAVARAAAAARAEAAAPYTVLAQSAPREDGYSDASGFGYCFRELRGGECASPLPGLRTQEVCCRGAGLAWGVHDCQSCSELLGNSDQVGVPDGLCPAGFERVNGSCEDVDECETGGRCQHGECANTHGGYTCVCPDGFLLDSSRSSCISQHVISEAKGPCFRVLRDGGCSLPILRNITKQICCCSRVGKAWGRGCQLCPPFGSEGFREICPAGPGYHYSASDLRYNTRPLGQEPPRVSLSQPRAPSSTSRPRTDVDECHRVPPPCDRGRCENTPGSFLCVCPAGYQAAPHGAKCQDVDECIQSPGLCGRGVCENLPGSFHCVCPAGFRGSACEEDVDECAQEPPPCGPGRCDNTAGSFHCACPAGFRSRGPGAPCQDVDECARSPPPCTYGRCENTEGSFQCVCPTGFQPSAAGSECEDVDECENHLACPGQECVNSPGSFQCRACPAGHHLHHGRCTDVDECRSGASCGPHGHCTNTEGSFRCTCAPGYRAPPGRPGPCADVNECLEGDFCFPNGECLNTDGSFACTCAPGYRPGPRGASCLDVDECSEEDLCQSGICTNTDGSFECVCPPGHRAGPDLASCLDVDECRERGPALCGSQRCENSPGSYRCVRDCDPGYHAGPEGTCDDVDECQEYGPGICGAQRCENTPGSYRCTPACDPGYQPTPGGGCQDVNECETLQGVCGAALCENVEGSFLCVCPNSPEEFDPMTGRCVPPRTSAGTFPGPQPHVPASPSLPARLPPPPSRRPSPPRQGPVGSGHRECYFDTAAPDACDNILARNVTWQECCCTVGEGWGSGCRIQQCPGTETAEYQSLCPHGRGYLAPSGDPSLRRDDNLGVCWQEVGADLVCSRPRLDRQATYTECCCLYGEAWGMDCALCPAQDSDDFEALCNVLRPPAYGPPRPGGFGLPYEYGPDLGSPYQGLPYGPELYLPPVLPYDPYPPPPGPFARREAPYGTPPFDMPDFEDDGGPYGESEAPAPPGPGSRWRYRSRDTRGSVPEPEESPEGGSYAGAQAGPYEGLEAEECGILDGCAHGRCVRVPEGFTCDCFDGYRLDMTRMACVDINECDEAEAAAQLCVNARCVNTDGSFRCICRPGFAPSHEPHHCTPARPRA
ncbi:Latent-transforming growth factor beta-binding protein 4, partial [Eschrichtius robustus]|nr:Latent-transforming growth factor beta-binding protein 4 [Eschrichtius robustus]